MPHECRGPSPRCADIDWARGVAVIIMIQAHVLDRWTPVATHASLLYRRLDIVNGFAAPLFLWLAGISLAFAGESALRRTGSRRAAWHLVVCRGLEVFILAFLFRLQSYFFNPGGEPIALFRVDILNVLGLAIALAGLTWGIASRRSAQIVALATAASLIALVTPIVTSAAWVDRLPTWFQWYLRRAGEHTVFTLFPWAGFTFGGAAVGSLLAACPHASARDRLQTALALSGLSLVVLGFYAATLPSIYGHSRFWTTSPTFFVVRVGLLLLLGSGLYALAAAARPRQFACGPLLQLGRSSLFVYWIHVPLVYGWVSWPLHHRLTVWQALAAVGLVSLTMYALVDLRDRLLTAWSGRRMERPVSGGEAAAV